MRWKTGLQNLVMVSSADDLDCFSIVTLYGSSEAIVGTPPEKSDGLLSGELLLDHTPVITSAHLEVCME